MRRETLKIQKLKLHFLLSKVFHTINFCYSLPCSFYYPPCIHCLSCKNFEDLRLVFMGDTSISRNMLSSHELTRDKHKEIFVFFSCENHEPCFVRFFRNFLHEMLYTFLAGLIFLPTLLPGKTLCKFFQIFPPKDLVHF